MTAETLTPQAVAIYEADSRPSIHELVSVWQEGVFSEDIPGLLNLCSIVAEDPASQWLYQFHCAGPDGLRRGRGLDTLVSWCHGIAAEAASTAARYRPERMANYRRRWARQAGCDGAALAMWGREVRDVLPGVNKRSEQYGCRPADYLQVRSYAEVEADTLLRSFRTDMEQAATERFDASFRARYLLATGREIPRAYA
jgi:hypothetical protein